MAYDIHSAAAKRRPFQEYPILYPISSCRYPILCREWLIGYSTETAELVWHHGEEHPGA
jgi:hypothetical protein